MKLSIQKRNLRNKLENNEKNNSSNTDLEKLSYLFKIINNNEKDTKKIFDKLYSLIYKPFFDKIKTRSVLHNLLLLELKYFFSLRILHERF